MISKYKDTLVYNSLKGFNRTTKHEFISYLNLGKDIFIGDFIDEYRRMLSVCLDEIWDKKCPFEHKNQKYFFHLKRRKFSNDLPKFFKIEYFNCLKFYKGNLSGRMLSCLVNQLCNILNGELKSSKALKHRFEKPNLENINPMIQSKHIEFIINENENSDFKYYVKLVNFTNKRNENIIIPIKTHKVDDKYTDLGKRCGAVQLTKESLNFIYDIEGKNESDNKRTEVIGADMGQRKILTLSDGQMTPKEDSQKKTFNVIENKINRKKKNSKAYKRSLKEMKIFTNEVLNKLNISGIKELRFESNKGIKQSTGNAHKYWQTETIQKKIKSMCEENHVDLTYTIPTFKSQRCFKCGFVHKENRDKEEFKCKKCSHTIDADINGAMNNTLTLPYDNLWSYHKYNRTSGFFWRENGISVDGNTQTGSAESPDINTDFIEQIMYYS